MESTAQVTEYLPDQQGRKLQLVGVQDLASSYRLEPAAAHL